MMWQKAGEYNDYNLNPLNWQGEIVSLTKLGDVSDVAFMKRFQKCGKWLEWGNENLPWEVPEAVLSGKIPRFDGGRVI